ncbi:hypothetical protein ACFVHB_33435 [Kitasatospora sp. NPDC127111]|uniref:hypothetical protein n=1 Tax=Kitasatospora sp. NPDC127111 TaxID=3345363 RepID=UPI00363726CC
MTIEQIPNPVAPTGNSLLLDPALPFPERVAAAARAWVDGGRGTAGLVDGRAFFALRCWQVAGVDRGETFGEPTLSYLKHAYDALGGRFGWDLMLRQRVVCACHGDTWRLENIEVCLGCLRFLCYQLDGPCCAGAEIVG